MKIAIISDIHANIEAFRSVMKTIDDLSISKIICLGDIVGYGPNPVECIEILMERNIQCVMGNHDAALCGKISIEYFNSYASYALEVHQSMLSKHHIEYLAALPDWIQQGAELFIHGAITQPFDYMIDSIDISVNKELLKRDFPKTRKVFYGHTHIRYFNNNGCNEVPKDHAMYDVSSDTSIFFLNPGSVGQPRGGFDSRASFMVFDDDEKSIRYYYVEYNIEKTYQSIIDRNLPAYLGERLFSGL